MAVLDDEDEEETIILPDTTSNHDDEEDSIGVEEILDSDSEPEACLASQTYDNLNIANPTPGPSSGSNNSRVQMFGPLLQSIISNNSDPKEIPETISNKARKRVVIAAKLNHFKAKLFTL